MPGANTELELRTHLALAEIGRAEWARVTGPGAPPFLDYEWLDALERTGCVGSEQGWAPLHLGLYRSGRLVAAAPAYVKGHSDGEFVFDQSWARFSVEQLGRPYYPKLLIAVPFTPATGPRLGSSGELALTDARRALLAGAEALAADLDLSGVHVLFSDRAEAEALAAQGMIHRHGVQYHWANEGYATFAEFLGRFSSKRRAQIRREQRALDEQGIALEVLTGAGVTEEAIAVMADCYRATVDKFFWGRRYLTPAFFRAVAERMPERLLLVMARRRATGRYVAGAFNLLGADALYGRYWGALEEHPFLHFNVCYYAGIEAAIARGLARFEPGAGGEHKRPRGFVPTVTHSVHLLRERELAYAVEDFVERERAAVARVVAGAAPRSAHPAAAE